jgi:NTP pyrophosphatase (non-canonical NTP hydrolase)
MSAIQLKLEEYLQTRGMAMPYYRRGSKITEEAGELVEALQDYLKKPSPKNLRHFKEEVADVVIVAAIAAQVGNFSVEEALEWKIEKDRGRGHKSRRQNSHF